MNLRRKIREYGPFTFLRMFYNIETQQKMDLRFCSSYLKNVEFRACPALTEEREKIHKSRPGEFRKEKQWYLTYRTSIWPVCETGLAYRPSI